MTDFVCVSCTRFALRLALTGAVAGLLAGCANSERLGDPLSNPFQTSANVSQPSPSSGVAASMPVSPVQSRPLSAPSASYNPPPQQPSSPVAAISPPRGGQSVAGWSAQGGSPVVVAQGETATVLANRYGIPVDALVRTNGLSSAAQIQPGSHIVIPVYNAALAASSGAAAGSKTAATAKTAGAPPRSLASQAEDLKSTKARALATKTAAEEKAAKEKAAKQAQKLAQNTTVKTPAQKQPAATSAPKSAAVTAKQEPVRMAKAEAAGETKGPRDAAPAAAPQQAKTGAVVSEAANPEFRWPARGRIIQSFKSGGNDGINIAVPEGTSVKAAESGVVAYAGNELKGYGNLILIRHPNGFVSAYANTSDIEVKPGETVKRGQTIAKSGQTGNVASPQLHFELRKGTTPVDPTQYLAGV
jgi:murein DD-endopeptidase MepM/ murein hydrolase activator NlpD